MPRKHFIFSSPPFPKWHPNPSAPLSGRGVPSPSGTLLPDALSLLGRDSASLPAGSSCSGWDAVACDGGLQPPMRLWRPLERSGGAHLLGIIGLLDCHPCWDSSAILQTVESHFLCREGVLLCLRWLPLGHSSQVVVVQVWWDGSGSG